MLLDMFSSIICVDVRGSRKAISDIDSCMDDWLHGSGHIFLRLLVFSTVSSDTHKFLGMPFVWWLDGYSAAAALVF